MAENIPFPRRSSVSRFRVHPAVTALVTGLEWDAAGVAHFFQPAPLSSGAIRLSDVGWNGSKPGAAV
ncbi:MAG: hypothetical protein JO362_00865 [Streptomycetaceae bacterium]|nr:hypothetical protein [Streptomycetaceae bacterium]